MKYIFSVIAIFVLLVAALLFAAPRTAPPADLKRPVVATSFYPLYFFSVFLADRNADVKNITPPGTEPHDYEPTTGDIATIDRSSLLVINGGGMEPWYEKMRAEIRKKNIPVVTASDGIPLIQQSESGAGVPDPHVWLDPVLAKQEVAAIAEGMKRADPSNTAAYDARATQLAAQLDGLDTEFRQGLARCRRHDIVTSHAALGYPARRYGFRQIAIQGLSPEEEPSPAKLAEIADVVKQAGIRYIFSESLVSPKLAATLARETGGVTVVFNPLESLTAEEISRGTDYFSVQRQNLANLRLALECD